MGRLTKEEILGADDIERVEVEVPQWGGTVLVQALTAQQRGVFSNQVVDQKKGGRTIRLQDIQVRLCAISMVDENGRRLFSDAEMHQLAKKSSAALQIVFEAAQRISGLSDEQVEEFVGNSDETQSDDSLSD